MVFSPRRGGELGGPAGRLQQRGDATGRRASRGPGRPVRAVLPEGGLEARGPFSTRPGRRRAAARRGIPRGPGRDVITGPPRPISPWCGACPGAGRAGPGLLIDAEKVYGLAGEGGLG
ncbi:hypothetical protein TNIN_500361 [Trichonephila inaurata madagascariensis]|uniref:Uncharacterized protein n=1 Tax=Trichonephila inaurata madagascariensis TaxID=2747483 RepID=A0A8X6XGP6_9ARAC|nr:hypothetical protein TNIN_500361 [Trichonephila inaurata madagascariensis]